MPIHIRIPSNLRSLSGGNSSVVVQAHSVDEALGALVESWPELRARIFAEPAQLHSFVNVFVGDRNIRDLDGLATPLRESTELLIVPALAGG